MADVPTKPLSFSRFSMLREKLGVADTSPSFFFFWRGGQSIIQFGNVIRRSTNTLYPELRCPQYAFTLHHSLYQKLYVLYSYSLACFCFVKLSQTHVPCNIVIRLQEKHTIVHYIRTPSFINTLHKDTIHRNLSYKKLLELNQHEII